MFKAKLIEDASYYKLRRKAVIFGILCAFLLPLVFNFYSHPLWLRIVLLCLYVFVLGYAVLHRKQITVLVSSRQLEMDENEIRITSKKGKPFEVIRMKEIDELIVQDDVAMSGESFEILKKEVIGKVPQNYLILRNSQGEKRLDFEVDSYYMIEQFKKVIRDWKQKGYPVRTTTEAALA